MEKKSAQEELAEKKLDDLKFKEQFMGWFWLTAIIGLFILWMMGKI